MLVAERFVGRTDALARLERAFAHTRTSSLACALVLGPAGIGKSALLHEFSERVRAAGARVLAGRARPPEDGGAVATLWRPVLRALRQPLAPADDDPLRAMERWFEATASALQAAGEQSPVVLALDDLQWIDAVSERLLRYILDELPESPLLVLAAARIDEAPPALTARLTRVDAFARIDLDGLAFAESVELVRGLAPGVRSARVLRDLHERSRGTPLLLRELAAQVRDDAHYDAASVPVTVGALVAANLDELETADRDLLIAIALAADAATPALLAATLDVSVPEVLPGLERLLATGLVVAEEPGAAVRMAHDLYGEAVASALSPVARGQFHARLAEAVRATAPSDDPVARARRAIHLVHAATVDPGLTQEAFALNLAAGDAAAARAGWSEAVRHYRHCLQIATSAPTPEADVGALLAALGNAEHFAGDAGAGWRHLLQGVELLAARGDHEAAAQAALVGGWHPLDHAGAQALYARCLDVPADALRPESRARLMALWALIDFSEQGERLAREAAALAAKHDLTVERLLLGAREGNALSAAGRFADAAAALTEIAREAEQLTPFPTPALWLDADLAALEFQRGALDRARRRARRAIIRSTVHGNAMEASYGAAVLIGIALARGEFDEIERLGRSVGGEGLMPLSLLAIARIVRGDVEGGAALLPGLAAVPPEQRPLVCMNNAAAHRLSGDRERARIAFEQGLELEPEMTNMALHELWLAAAAVAFDERADPAATRALADALAGEPELRFAIQSVDSGRARLALSLGRIDEAEEHVARALAWARGERARLDEGFTLTTAARIAQARDRPAEARTRLEAALAIFVDLGAATPAAQARAALAALPAGDSPGEPARSLSAREAEVLRLVAAGHTNPAIAEALSIAPGTAQRHVANILRKLGVARRAEAVRVALERGLLD